MLTVIIGENSVGKSLLLKRINQLVRNPKFLISEFPSSSCVDRTYWDFFLQEENIARYKKSIDESNVTAQAQTTPKTPGYAVENYTKQGFTHKLRAKDYSRNENKMAKFSQKNQNNLLKPKINEDELYLLVKKFTRIVNDNKDENQIDFIKRQIQKKLVFRDLFQLLKLDCFYQCEINSINEFLTDKHFSYKIQLRHGVSVNEEKDIELIHTKTGFRQTLNEVNSSERLMLHLYLILRDKDLIRIHENINLRQILFLDQIDTNLDSKHTYEFLRCIKDCLVQQMNFQCLVTTCNQFLIEQCNDECLFQMKYCPNKKEIMLNSLKVDALMENKRVISVKRNKMKVPYLNEVLKAQWEQSTSAELRMELNSKEKKIKDLNKIIYDQKNMVDKLEKDRAEFEKINRFSREKIVSLESQLDEINKCRDDTQSQSSLHTTDNVEKDNEVCKADWESGLENILKKSIDEFTDEDTKQFIEYLQMDIKSYKGSGREIIEKAIEHLGPNLYSSQLNFLNELIQNFDDTEYESLDNCCLRVVLNDKYILFSSNQSPLKPKEVRALCSIGRSTKDKG